MANLNSEKLDNILKGIFLINDPQMGGDLDF